MDEKYLCCAKFKRDDSNSYFVEFPDLEGCISFGRTIEEAMENAEAACAGWLLVAKNNNIDISNLSVTRTLKNNSVNDENQFQNLFLINLTDYIRKIDRKSVKKNLTLPSWLCALADERKVNYSKLLKEALLEKLDINEY